MYTIIRFTRVPTNNDLLKDIGSELNESIPGAYTGIRRAGDGFACDVSNADAWKQHRDAIMLFLERADHSVHKAREYDIDVCVDVAVESEDSTGRNVLSLYLDRELMARLVAMDVGLEFSVYGGRDEEIRDE